MKVLACYSIKGGVGKTSTAVNVAYLAALGGAPTLLWDLDPQGAATFLFRARPKVRGGATALVQRRGRLPGAVRGTDFDFLDLLPADFSYRNMDLALHATKQPTRRVAQLLRQVSGEYELVVLDCPPSVSLLSESVVRAADLLAVPLVPSALSLRTFDQLLEHLVAVSKRPPAVLGFFSMVDRRKRQHREAVARLPSERAQIRPLVVPAASIVEQMGLRRAPVVDFAPKSVASRSYVQLWEALRAELGLPG